MIIYKTTNLINGKFYIGQDSNNNPNYFGSGLLIKKAINKYGIENFKKEILDNALTKDELNEKEKFWIKELNSIIPNGYNITEGGTGGDTLTNHPNLNEIRKKITESISGEKNPNYGKCGKDNPLYGTHKSEETKEKISIANRGENNGMYDVHLYGELNGMYGKKDSEETRLKKSAAHKGKSTGPMTTEQKQHLSKIRIERGLSKGENNPNYGVHRIGALNGMYNRKHSEESKEKMRRTKQLNKLKKDEQQAAQQCC